MASTTRNLDIVIKVTDQATQSLVALEKRLEAFGRSVGRATGGGGRGSGRSEEQRARLQADREALEERKRINADLLADAERTIQRQQQLDRDAEQARRRAERDTDQARKRAAESQARDAERIIRDAERKSRAEERDAKRAADAREREARRAAAAEEREARRAATARDREAKRAAAAEEREARRAAAAREREARRAAAAEEREARRAERERTRAANAAARAEEQARRAAARSWQQHGLEAQVNNLRNAYALLASYLTGQFIRSLLDTTRQMQNVRLSFDAMMNSTKTGGQQFEFVRRLAEQFGLKVIELAGSYRQFVASTQAANLGMERQQRIFTLVTASARLAGASADQLQRFITGLSQALDRGVLNAEEFNQMQEAIPGVMNRVATALGKTNRELATTGVTMAEFVQGLEKALAGDIPKAAEIAETSVDAMLNRMENSWKEFLRGIGESQAGLQALKDIALLFEQAHDATARLGLAAPRAVSELKRLREELEQLQKVSLFQKGQDLLPWSTSKADREKQALNIRESMARIQKEMAEDEREAAQAAAERRIPELLEANRKAYQRTLDTMREYFESLKRTGMEEVARLEEERDTINKALTETQNRLKGLTENNRELRTEMEGQVSVLAREKQLREAAIQQKKDDAAESKRLDDQRKQDAEEAKQRELDARIELTAKYIGLSQGKDAENDYRDAMRGRSQEERNAIAQGLEHSDVLAKKNQQQREANELQEREAEGDKVINRLNQELARERGKEMDDTAKYIQILEELQVAEVKTTEAKKAKIDAIVQEIVAQRALNDWIKKQEQRTEEQRRGEEQYRGLAGEGYGTFEIPTGPTLEEERTAQFLRDVESRLIAIQQLKLDERAFEKWLIDLQNLKPEEAALLKWLVDMEYQVSKQQELFAAFAESVADFGESFTETISGAFEELLSNTENALYDLGGWLERFGKSLIKLFGEEIINLGLTPLKTAIKQFAEELAKNETIKKVVGIAINFIAGLFGGGGSGAYGGLSQGFNVQTSPYGAWAHGGIFGSPVALQRGGVITAPRLALMGEATPEAVVPLTAEGIARFTRGLQRGAPAALRETTSSSREHERRRFQDTVEALARRPVEVTVVLNNPIDPRRMGMQPEEVVQVVGRDINNDGVLRRIIVKNAQR